MSPSLHAEMIRTRQNEIAARTAQAHLVSDCQDSAARRRGVVRSRVYRALTAAALSLACLPFVAGAADGKAAASHTANATVRESTMAQRVQARIDSLQARGFVPLACTTHGTLLVNPHTGERTTINW